LPVELLALGKLFVETADAFKAPPVGCGELKDRVASSGTLLGDALSGKEQDRESDLQITVYKSMGIAMEDLVAAHLAYSVAKSRGVGRTVVL
jgi:ornithine cyclodeaminase/thiomorpholine-carboxylate dehydrogenase